MKRKRVVACVFMLLLFGIVGFLLLWDRGDNPKKHFQKELQALYKKEILLPGEEQLWQMKLLLQENLALDGEVAITAQGMTVRAMLDAWRQFPTSTNPFMADCSLQMSVLRIPIGEARIEVYDQVLHGTTSLTGEELWLKEENVWPNRVDVGTFSLDEEWMRQHFDELDFKVDEEMSQEWDKTDRLEIHEDATWQWIQIPKRYTGDFQVILVPLYAGQKVRTQAETFRKGSLIGMQLFYQMEEGILVTLSKDFLKPAPENEWEIRFEENSFTGIGKIRFEEEKVILDDCIVWMDGQKCFQIDASLHPFQLEEHPKIEMEVGEEEEFEELNHVLEILHQYMETLTL